jgi:hypothetical protein
MAQIASPAITTPPPRTQQYSRSRPRLRVPKGQMQRRCEEQPDTQQHVYRVVPPQASGPILMDCPLQRLILRVPPVKQGPLKGPFAVGNTVRLGAMDSRIAEHHLVSRQPEVSQRKVDVTG